MAHKGAEPGSDPATTSGSPTEAADDSWAVLELPGFQSPDGTNGRPFASVGKGSFSIKGFRPLMQEKMAKVKDVTYYMPDGDDWKGPYKFGLEIIQARRGLFYAYVQVRKARYGLARACLYGLHGLGHLS